MIGLWVEKEAVRKWTKQRNAGRLTAGHTGLGERTGVFEPHMDGLEERVSGGVEAPRYATAGKLGSAERRSDGDEATVLASGTQL